MKVMSIYKHNYDFIINSNLLDHKLQYFSHMLRIFYFHKMKIQHLRPSLQFVLNFQPILLTLDQLF